MKNKKDSKKKRLLALGFVSAPLLLKLYQIGIVTSIILLLISGSTTAVTEPIGHWQLLDNDTLTPINESYNMSLGDNRTTPFKLNVVGDANLSGLVYHFDKNSLIWYMYPFYEWDNLPASEWNFLMKYREANEVTFNSPSGEDLSLSTQGNAWLRGNWHTYIKAYADMDLTPGFGENWDLNAYDIEADHDIIGENNANFTKDVTARAYYGDGQYLDNVSGDSYWNRSGTTVYPFYDGDNVQGNGTGTFTDDIRGKTLETTDSGNAITINADGVFGKTILNFPAPLMTATVTFPSATTTLMGTTLTEAVSGQKSFTNSVVQIAQYLRHYGDLDTFMLFNPDFIRFQAGGRNMLTMTEGAIDVVDIDADYVNVTDSVTVGDKIIMENGGTTWNSYVNADGTYVMEWET